MKAHELELNTVYYSALWKRPLKYTGEEIRKGAHEEVIRGEGFEDGDSTIFVALEDVPKMQLETITGEG